MPDVFTDIVTIDDFRRGIQRRDAALVERALKAGVPVDTPVRGMHPLHLLLSADSENNAKVIHVLFAEGLHFSKTDDAPLQQVDHLLFGEDRANTVTVVLHAMEESLAQGGECYRLRPEALLNHHIALAGDDAGADVLAPIIAARLTALHGAVRDRLLGGTDALERQLMLKHYPKLGFWLEPFEMPPYKSARLRGVFAEGAAPLPDAAINSLLHS